CSRFSSLEFLDPDCNPRPDFTETQDSPEVLDLNKRSKPRSPTIHFLIFIDLTETPAIESAQSQD
ncbi:hypothetical protein BaRGS_00021696, partial [Batillaria attramentaria]